MKKKIEDPLLSFVTEYNKSKIDLNMLNEFAKLDDGDVIQLLKNLQNIKDKNINTLANGLINRRLFKFEALNKNEVNNLPQRILEKIKKVPTDLIFKGKVIEKGYIRGKEEIQILLKNEKIVPYSNFNSELLIINKIKHYICYYKCDV